MGAPLISKQLKKLPEPVAEKAAVVLQKGEREAPAMREIENWGGLSRGERNVLRDLRKRMKTQTTMAGSRGWARTTHEEIAERVGYSTKQVGRIIAGLEAKGVVENKAPLLRDKAGKVVVRNKKPVKRTHPGSTQSYAIHKQTCCFNKAS
jgi:hypothetical protein